MVKQTYPTSPAPGRGEEGTHGEHTYMADQVLWEIWEEGWRGGIAGPERIWGLGLGEGKQLQLKFISIRTSANVFVCVASDGLRKFMNNEAAQ